MVHGGGGLKLDHYSWLSPPILDLIPFSAPDSTHSRLLPQFQAPKTIGSQPKSLQPTHRNAEEVKKGSFLPCQRALVRMYQLRHSATILVYHLPREPVPKFRANPTN